MDVRQENIAKAHSNTCRWLYDRCEYKAWRDSDQRVNHHGFFWIKSKPGAGKSTLMKFLLNTAKQQLPQDIIVSFFFNARGDQLEQSVEGMYRHLLWQLLKTIPRLQSILKLPDSVASFQNGWPIAKLKSLFQEAILSLGKDRVTCFIDALDECPEDQVRDLIEFVEEIGGLATSEAIDFHVCFSSRYYPNIDIAKCQHLTLDGQEGHQQDIATYIKTKLRGKGKKIEQTRSAVQEKAQGVFLWAVLVVQILNKEIDRGNIHNLQRRLKEIPGGLHELFQDILNRDSQDNEHLIPVLRWIMYAKRPLSREELYFAIHGGAQNPIALNPWDSEEFDSDIMDLFILNSSKGLAEMTRGKKPTVQFIHESVRDYLRDAGLDLLRIGLEAIPEGSSHDYLKQCCSCFISEDVAQHLSLPVPLPKAKSDEAKQLRERASKLFPFLEYACNCLTYHAEKASSCGISQESFAESFPDPIWICIHDMFAIHDTRRYGGNNDKPFYIFAHQRHWNLFEQLGTQGKPCDLSPAQSEAVLRAVLASDRINSLVPLLGGLQSVSTSESMRTLRVAINTRNLVALRYVLQRRLKLSDICDVIFGKTVDTDSPGVLECLIDHGLHLSSLSSGEVCEFLLDAVHNGHEDSIRITARKTDLLSADSFLRFRSVLIMAFTGGNEPIIRFLVEHVAENASNVMTRKELLRIALITAIETAHEGIARSAHDRGADLVASNGSTALHRAPTRGYEWIVRLLLEKGADIHALISERWTALDWAYDDARQAIEELLLSQSAVLNGHYGDMLQAMSRKGDEAMVQLLLERGPMDNSSKRRREKETALYDACYYGQTGVVLLLLDHGVNPDPQSYIHRKMSNEGTPLGAAARHGHKDVVRLLLERGVFYTVLLARFAAEGKVSALRVLLDNGASAMSGGWRALGNACLKGHERCTKLLLDHGADMGVSAPSFQSNLVCQVVVGRKIKILIALLDKGATFRAKDSQTYRPALKYAVENEYTDIIEVFRERGITLQT